MKDNNDKYKDDNFLLYIPSKKHKTWEVRNDKVYLTFHHDKAVEKFMRWLVKKPSISDMELDELGSKTWLLIDGEKTVFQIGKDLVQIFGDKIEPVYDRLVMYLRYLNRRGWISFKTLEEKKAD